MKILKLNFKNINSLAGENEIDFTQSVFTYDGLFAITGKTGSGKSSILDAITLALYGKTPRLEVSGTENEVMTKGKNDCYSEVIFEANKKIWKTSWKQERNRNGKLKPVNRMIADEQNNIIADQIRSCDTKIVAIIGLTFEQFTKVILLAQGSFAAFLQADKNDKGALLEQITGTEIYGEISRKVFERNRNEKEKLSLINAELQSIKMLSAEEKQRLITDIETIKKQTEQTTYELEQLEIARKWLHDVRHLENQINQIHEKLPILQAQATQANIVFEQQYEILQNLKKQQAQQEPIFKQVRELDTKISEKEKMLAPISNSILELEKEHQILAATLTNQTSQLEKLQKVLTEKQNWLHKHHMYEQLTREFSVIEKEHQLLIATENEIDDFTKQITSLQNEVTSKKADFQKSSSDFNIKNNELELKIQELESQKSALKTLLNGKEISELQSEKEKISALGVQLKNWLEIENQIEINKREILDFTDKDNAFETTLEQLSEKLQSDKETLKHIDNQIDLLNKNIQLTLKIQSLDAHRKQLKHGEACPLCGALEHPFMEKGTPEINDNETKLASLKEKHLFFLNNIQENEKKLTKTLSDKENNLINKDKQEKKIQEFGFKQNEIENDIKRHPINFSFPTGDDKSEKLNVILSEKRNHFKTLNSLIESANQLEKQISYLRDTEIITLQNERDNALNAKNKSETEQKLAEQQLSQKQLLINSLQTKQETQKNAFLEKIKQYDTENIESLKNYVTLWNENKQQTENITLQITNLTSDIAINNKSLENNSSFLKNKQNEKELITAEKEKLTHSRNLIFGSKSVEAEENHLKNLLEKSETAKTKTEKAKNDANTEFERHKAIAHEKQTELSALKTQQITTLTEEELLDSFQEKKRLYADLSQKVGACEQTLKLNDENIKQNETKRNEKEKQEAIYHKWSSLNELIGASDGKKYRNFAQALTFEHLISLANQQLQKMSERYLLKRSNDNGANPFELLVIDKFQNDQQRTAQNLSGGEKFVVSLALALGLASMASKNMEINTMFIDEGFGTLDTDYLDVALSALSNLQSEGKIIGVISHLSELKERIATHIEVISTGNGHSKIQIVS
ncbi:AAA family ATPase [Capnocytophaga sp.]|uniref:AAA family ATPase n=1 Tax=Capnocytophaga sp. TaxID=44737 RepID=UPI0026DCA7A4|nr:AAA family ATPase [Capnocytophaga sp.]MDO5104927.1 AAA family ATPase [Capnocytophaga sp.]